MEAWRLSMLHSATGVRTLAIAIDTNGAVRRRAVTARNFGPLEADIRCCYGQVGFQASYLVFPTPGCWEVAAQIDDIAESRLTFVTRVVKIGEGPVRLNPRKN
jgi:hypothetical protein